MSKEDWESRFDREFEVTDVYGFDVVKVNNAKIFKDFISQELDKQKQEIIEIINSYSGDACYAKDDIINKIKDK